MKKIIFDIETRNIFEDVGKADPTLLDLSVVCAHDSETGDYLTYTQEELLNLWPILEKADMLVGYNSDHFDIPILNKYYPGDLTRIKSLDILKEIKNSLGRRIRLNLVAEGTLGRKKTGNGLEAVVWWKNGEIDKIKKYCIEDVKITKELYEYALKNGVLKYKDLSEIREIKLDTSKWEKKENTLINHTLPF